MLKGKSFLFYNKLFSPNEYEKNEKKNKKNTTIFSVT